MIFEMVLESLCLVKSYFASVLFYARSVYSLVLCCWYLSSVDLNEPKTLVFVIGSLDALSAFGFWTAALFGLLRNMSILF